MKYRFINEHRHEYKVATMCRVLKVARAGFYAWLHQPNSNRAIEALASLEVTDQARKMLSLLTDKVINRAH
mgnify:CR=1 FL=1